jgi:inorganic pyrophosphatase
VAKKSKFPRPADPSRLPPYDEDGEGLHDVIETPKASRNKYAFDKSKEIFALTKVLQDGMAFPYDFGSVPSARAEDGDPVGVLVLMDEPAAVGCLLSCRIIGVIEGEQGKKKDPERNDRIIAIEQANRSFADIRHVRDLGKQFVRELEDLFVNYHELSGTKYRALHVRGPGEAEKRIKNGIRAFRKSQTL